VKFRRQKTADNTVNVTPLIDVVFLLLIFFMVSTTFTKETQLSIHLPEADGEIAESVPDTIEIGIDAEGHYSLNNKALVNQKILTLMKGLDKLAEGDTDSPVIIRADAKASHQAVVTAMDAAGRSGLVHLSITTQRPEK